MNALTYSLVKPQERVAVPKLKTVPYLYQVFVGTSAIEGPGAFIIMRPGVIPIPRWSTGWREYCNDSAIRAIYNPAEYHAW